MNKFPAAVSRYGGVTVQLYRKVARGRETALTCRIWDRYASRMMRLSIRCSAARAGPAGDRPEREPSSPWFPA